MSGRSGTRRALGAAVAGAVAGIGLRRRGAPAGRAAVGADRVQAAPHALGLAPGPGAAPGRQAVRFFPVAPPFEAYYGLVDGPVVMGQAISPLTVFGGLPAQYFEKARLEDHVATNASGAFAEDFQYGLLVDELSAAEAPAPVGGDASTLTYASIRALSDPALRVPPPAGFAGGVAPLPDGGTFVPYAADLAAALGQVVPAPFWAYLQRPDLFPGGWLHDVGLPLTAAVPARVDKGRVVGEDVVFVADVPITVQAFQRTVLTYDAANPEGFLVERANAGTDFAGVFPDQVAE